MSDFPLLEVHQGIPKLMVFAKADDQVARSLIMGENTHTGIGTKAEGGEANWPCFIKVSAQTPNRPAYHAYVVDLYP